MIYDVLIIGAGISGLNAAYHVSNKTSKGATYAILDSRSSIGGTWDLFRYPGVRCDSDIFTFSFPWNPWKGDKPVADGGEMLDYLKQSAELAGIDKHILFNHTVSSASWDSEQSTWTVAAEVGSEKPAVFKTRFLVLGTGYYDHGKPMEYSIPGLDGFKGTLVEPQFWPADLSYTDKKVVILGSGATAVTLLPNLAREAANITMLQRSPSYILSMPNKKTLWDRLLSMCLPRFAAAWLSRLIRLVQFQLFFNYCKKNPLKVRKLLMDGAAQQLPSSVPVDPHFAPRYNPWEQRLCMCLDGDFYKSFHSGKVSIVTDEVDRVTEQTILLKSGQTIEADIIVAATGLKLRFCGGVRLYVDGEPVEPSDKFVWKGCMVEDVPNLGFIIGYDNASWTLAAEVHCTLLARLIRSMRKQSASSVTPRLDKGTEMQSVPVFNLSSTYFKPAADILPKGGQGQWAYKKSYLTDMWDAHWGDIVTGLEVK